MVNVTLWPDTWARLRGVVRRHALLLVDGELQRESSVVNVDRPRRPAAGRGRGDAGAPGSAARASGSSAMPGCGRLGRRDARRRQRRRASDRAWSSLLLRHLAVRAACRWSRGRAAGSGWRGWRKRRYQAAAAAKNAPDGTPREQRLVRICWTSDVLRQPAAPVVWVLEPSKNRRRTDRANAIAWKPTEARAMSPPMQVARPRREEAGDERPCRAAPCRRSTGRTSTVSDVSSEDRDHGDDRGADRSDRDPERPCASGAAAGPGGRRAGRPGGRPGGRR